MNILNNFLLIDDDDDDRELFCEALESLSFRATCFTATDGNKALNLMDSKEFEPPHLIFLDINMPLMDGWECLTLLKSREKYKNIPVIMYSTSSYPEDVEKAISLGAAFFFSKPADFEELKKSLEIIILHVRHKYTPIPQ